MAHRAPSVGGSAHPLQGEVAPPAKGPWGQEDRISSEEMASAFLRQKQAGTGFPSLLSLFPGPSRLLCASQGQPDRPALPPSLHRPEETCSPVLRKHLRVSQALNTSFSPFNPQENGGTGALG